MVRSYTADPSKTTDERMCAKEALFEKFSHVSRDEFERRLSSEDKTRDLKELGCSDWTKHVSVGEIVKSTHPGEFKWAEYFWPELGFGLGITVVVSLAKYGFIRASVAWVNVQRALLRYRHPTLYKVRRLVGRALRAVDLK